MGVSDLRLVEPQRLSKSAQVLLACCETGTV
jgi:hypothetical protein